MALAGLVLWTCPCWNVEVAALNGGGPPHDRGDNNDNASVSRRQARTTLTLSLDNDSLMGRDPFFQNVEILDAPKGFTVNKKLECLCHSRRVDDWIITRCINCSKETHAVSSSPHKSNTCYLSVDMKANTTASILPKLKDYSTAYNIVINQSQRLPSAVGHVSSSGDQSAKHLQEINLKVTDYLETQRVLMNERIRRFENEQKQSFNLLESQAWQDHNALAEIVNSHQTSSKPIGTNNEAASARHANNSKTTTSPFGIRATSTVKNSGQPIAAKRNTFRPQRSTEESMFMMDEDEENYGDEERVFESSDEDRGGPDEDVVTKADQMVLFATSLPISMPGVWQKSRHLQNPTENFGEYDLDESPKKREGPVEGIAASIQALAMSVRGDGTEMFGARPRPRLNTLD